jgi:AcrR family transcriptional regulator
MEQRGINERTQRLRRVPQQSRSRDRVERILDTAAAQVVAEGVEALGTRTIAEAAGVPVASLYQYFADKDDILLALVERDLEALDVLVRKNVEALSSLDISSIVRTTVQVVAAAYRERPAFVAIWMRGRSNPTIREYAGQYNQRTAVALHAMGREAGLFGDAFTIRVCEVAVEIGDRLFEWAFESAHDGQPDLLEEGIRAVTAYLELYASADNAERGVQEAVAAQG